MNSELKQYIINIAEPIVKSLGLEIWGLEILTAPKPVARLFVDLPLEKLCQAQEGSQKPQPQSPEDGKAPIKESAFSADIDQCEEISRRLGLALEVEDVFPSAWVLEVSTPGLERKFFTLDQMRPYIGDVIDVGLLAPLEDGERKSYRGKLETVGNDYFEIAPCAINAQGEVIPDDQPLIRIPWEKVRKVSRVHIFVTPPKPGKTSKKPKK